VAARDPLGRAFEEADELGHGWIGPEHLVLAMLEDESVAGKALRGCSVDHDSYRRA
jgi:ATP-dependent Clp protease ATP-binding subunit ClpA